MQVGKWNTRDVILKTPLLSLSVTDGDVEPSMVTLMVGHFGTAVAFAEDVILREGDPNLVLYCRHAHPL